MIICGLLVGTVACAGGSDDDAASDAVADAGRCRVEFGSSTFEFDTAMSSCDDAVSAGRAAAVANGLATSAELDGALIAFGSVCEVLQGETTMTAEPENMALAEGLAAEVCPGDLSKLMPEP